MSYMAREEGREGRGSRSHTRHGKLNVYSTAERTEGRYSLAFSAEVAKMEVVIEVISCHGHGERGNAR